MTPPWRRAEVVLEALWWMSRVSTVNPLESARGSFLHDAHEGMKLDLESLMLSASLRVIWLSSLTFALPNAPCRQRNFMMGVERVLCVLRRQEQKTA